MKDAGKIRFFEGKSPREKLRKVVFLFLVAAVLVIAVVSLVNAIQWADKPFAGFLVNERRVLGNVGLYEWTGTQAGLKYPDKILKADGRILSSAGELREVVKNKEIGEPVVYTIDRGGSVIEIAIPTMRFALSDFLAIYGTYFIAGIVILLLGVVVFLMKPDTHVSWVFLFSALSFSIYYFTAFDIMTTYLGFVRLYILVSVLYPTAAVHLSLVFPGKTRIMIRYPPIAYLPYILAAALIIPLQFTYPSPLYGTLSKSIPLVMNIGALSLLTSCAFAFVRSMSSISRQRAKVVLFGALLAFLVPSIAQVVGTTFGKAFGKYQVLNNYLTFFNLIFPVSLAYAIAKHNLFDVDVFIKRTLGYAIMTAVVGAAYIGLQVGLESIVLAPVFGPAARKVTPVLFAVLVVFLFNPLNRRVQEVVDQMFYRKKFDYKATVTAVSDALSSVLDLDAIVRKIVHTVRTEMFIDRSGLVLAGAQGERLPAYFVGDDPSGAAEAIRHDALAVDDPLMALVMKKKKLVTKYDVAEDPNFADVRETCGKRFEELGASLAVPLVYQGEVNAVLAVGHKKSGHFFTREDVDLLQTLASHGAVAIENAHMAEQMKKEEVVRANLSRYLSPQIVDRIVKEDVKVNLGGDRKVVTVLFSDIRNFTTITESRPPDQLVHILNEYFTEMAKIIFDHQGSLDKYIGDAIVAVFGSLIPVENPAENAVAAAVAMMKRLPALNRRWEARYAFSMNIGIGINTGEVFLGNIGSPERMEFTVIGDAVNVASRFSGLAKSGQILLTKNTLACLGQGGNYKELPPTEVKGKSGKMEVFEVLYIQSVS